MTKQQQLVLYIAIMASFVAFLDGSVVNVALPAIAREVGGGPDRIAALPLSAQSFGKENAGLTGARTKKKTHLDDESFFLAVHNFRDMELFST